MGEVFGKLQKIGKALMLPIAVMPAAAILLRLGAGVPGIEGLLATIMLKAGTLYNKYHNIKLPEFLGFFGGKRFVPIVTAFAGLVVGIIFGYVWPNIQFGIDAVGNAAIQAGPVGTFFFGFGNRLLIPVGLHHVLNSIFWFTFGSFKDAAGVIVNGDLHRYFAGDPTAGIFMAGWYPVMMFGLPAACFAMYKRAKPENRKFVGGMFFSIAFTSALTGITEPIEFLFCYVSPVAYLVHALLSGVALAVTQGLGILHGFGFSAGLIDYVLNMHLATNGLMLIPLGLAFAAIYYFAFYYLIEKLDIPTPGRVDEVTDEGEHIVAEKGIANIAKEYIALLGGRENIVDVDSCITRLRLTLKDNSNIDEAAIKRLGAAGLIKPNKKNVQVVVGTHAELIAEDIKQLLA